MNLNNDQLFKLIMLGEDIPQLLTGEKSLLAIEMLIQGYLSNCHDSDADRLSAQWYGEFVAWLQTKYNQSSDSFGTRHILCTVLGYDDVSGVDRFYEELNTFAAEKYGQNPRKAPIALAPGEARGMPLFDRSVRYLAEAQLLEHCDQYLGIPIEDRNHTEVRLRIRVSREEIAGQQYMNERYVCLAYDRRNPPKDPEALLKKLEELAPEPRRDPTKYCSLLPEKL